MSHCSLDPAKDGLITSNAAYAAKVIAANANVQTTITQGAALVLGKTALTAAIERSILTSVGKKYAKAYPVAPAARRRLLQASPSTAATVDLTNPTVVADLLTQSIAAAQASGAITAAAAATAQSSVAIVSAAVANINAAVSKPRCSVSLLEIAPISRR